MLRNPYRYMIHASWLTLQKLMVQQCSVSFWQYGVKLPDHMDFWPT